MIALKSQFWKKTKEGFRKLRARLVSTRPLHNSAEGKPADDERLTPTLAVPINGYDSDTEEVTATLELDTGPSCLRDHSPAFITGPDGAQLHAAIERRPSHVSAEVTSLNLPDIDYQRAEQMSRVLLNSPQFQQAPVSAESIVVLGGGGDMQNSVTATSDIQGPLERATMVPRAYQVASQNFIDRLAVTSVLNPTDNSMGDARGRSPASLRLLSSASSATSRGSSIAWEFGQTMAPQIAAHNTEQAPPADPAIAPASAETPEQPAVSGQQPATAGSQSTQPPVEALPTTPRPSALSGQLPVQAGSQSARLSTTPGQLPMNTAPAKENSLPPPTGTGNRVCFRPEELEDEEPIGWVMVPMPVYDESLEFMKDKIQTCICTDDPG